MIYKIQPSLVFCSDHWESLAITEESFCHRQLAISFIKVVALVYSFLLNSNPCHQIGNFNFHVDEFCSGLTIS